LTATLTEADEDTGVLLVAVRVNVYVPAEVNVAVVERLVGEVMVTPVNGDAVQRYVSGRVCGSEAVPVNVTELVGSVTEAEETDAETDGRLSTSDDLSR
jgi:hypothetical protein